MEGDIEKGERVISNGLVALKTHTAVAVAHRAVGNLAHAVQAGPAAHVLRRAACAGDLSGAIACQATAPNALVERVAHTAATPDVH